MTRSMDDAVTERQFTEGMVMDHAWFVRCQCGEGLLCNADARVEHGRCPSCGELPMAGAVPVYRTRINGAVAELVQMDPLGEDAARMSVTRLNEAEGRDREVLRILGIDHARRSITVGMAHSPAKPKRKKASGKSPTRRVVPVARSWRARDERMLERPREPITLGGDPLDVVREAYPNAPVSADVVAQMPEFNRLAGVRVPLKWGDK